MMKRSPDVHVTEGWVALMGQQYTQLTRRDCFEVGSRQRLLEF